MYFVEAWVPDGSAAADCGGWGVPQDLQQNTHLQAPPQDASPPTAPMARTSTDWGAVPQDHQCWQQQAPPRGDSPPTMARTSSAGSAKLLKCQVAGCNADLAAEEKSYCMKKRICSEHMRAEVILDPTLMEPQRFCFQCGRVEPLTNFEGNKRSCRWRLQRRRMPPRRSVSWTAGCSSSSAPLPPTHESPLAAAGQLPWGGAVEAAGFAPGPSVAWASSPIPQAASPALLPPAGAASSAIAEELARLQEQQRLLQQQQQLLELQLVRQAFSSPSLDSSGSEAHMMMAGATPSLLALPALSNLPSITETAAHAAQLPTTLQHWPSHDGAAAAAGTAPAVGSQHPALARRPPLAFASYSSMSSEAATAGSGEGAPLRGSSCITPAAAGTAASSRPASPQPGGLVDAMLADDGGEPDLSGLGLDDLEEMFAAELTAALHGAGSAPAPAAAACPQQQQPTAFGAAAVFGQPAPSAMGSQAHPGSSAGMAGAAHAAAGCPDGQAEAVPGSGGALDARTDSEAAFQALQQRQQRLHVLLQSVHSLYNEVRDLTNAGRGAPGEAVGPAASVSVSAAHSGDADDEMQGVGPLTS